MPHAVHQLLVVRVVLLREREYLTQVVHRALNRLRLPFFWPLYHEYDTNNLVGGCNVH